MLLNLPDCRCWIRLNWQKVSVVVFGDPWPKVVLRLVDFIFLLVRSRTFQTRCHRTTLWLFYRFILELHLSPLIEGEVLIFRTCGCWWRKFPLKLSVSTCLEECDAERRLQMLYLLTHLLLFSVMPVNLRTSHRLPPFSTNPRCRGRTLPKLQVFLLRAIIWHRLRNCESGWHTGPRWLFWWVCDLRVGKNLRFLIYLV